MRRIIGILLLFAAFTLGAALRSPKMRLATPDVWLGEIVQDSVAAYDLWVKNIGASPLVISHINRSCSCVSAVMPAEPIAPGDSAVIEVSIKTKGFMPGRINKYISIISNDPEYITRVYFSGIIISGNESENE